MTERQIQCSDFSPPLLRCWTFDVLLLFIPWIPSALWRGRRDERDGRREGKISCPTICRSRKAATLCQPRASAAPPWVCKTHESGSPERAKKYLAHVKRRR